MLTGPHHRTRKLILAGLCCAGIGFAIGWIAFDSPFSSAPPSEQQVADRVLVRVRNGWLPDANTAKCTRRQATTDEFRCVIDYYPGGSDDIGIYYPDGGLRLGVRATNDLLKIGLEREDE